MTQIKKVLYTAKTHTTAEIGLSRNDAGNFVLSAALAVAVTGVDQKTAEDLAESAHKICPYSNAIRGNVDVGITVSARSVVSD
jgi:osmotically inducible protein OsmC